MKLYSSCYQLPLSRFIRCICDDDYAALIIEGQPTNDELIEAWSIVYKEYIDLSGSHIDNHAYILQMEISQLHFRHIVAIESVEVLRQYYYPELVNLLKNAGYNFKFNPDDPESYQNDLDRVLIKSKSLLAQKEQKELQLNAIKPQKEGEKINRSYFDQWLVILSKFSAYHIDEEKTTVSRFITVMNTYIKHYEQLNAKHAG